MVVVGVLCGKAAHNPVILLWQSADSTNLDLVRKNFSFCPSSEPSSRRQMLKEDQQRTYFLLLHSTFVIKESPSLGWAVCC
jgi:hypothetical protein